MLKEYDFSKAILGKYAARYAQGANMEQATDLKVFITSRDSTCDECGENLGRKAWITLNKDKGALCLACADLDHLVFLPSGNTALTGREG